MKSDKNSKSTSNDDRIQELDDDDVSGQTSNAQGSENKDEFGLVDSNYDLEE